MLLSGRARLIDNATLRSQLAGLERKASASGHATVTHASVSSAHDDVATAACGALVTAGSAYAYDTAMRWVDGATDADARAEWDRMRLHAYLRAVLPGVPY